MRLIVARHVAAWIVVALAAGSSVAGAQEALQPTLHASDDRQGTDILGALGDSFNLLLIEHAWRIGLQEKTRNELGGPFWSDYKRSVRVPNQWGDTDAGWVNYIGHPIHGAAAGYIWLDHEPDAPLDFNWSRKYWMSRARAMAWSGVYSLQFEIGPLSEASIGNVGLNPETTGWVDHVITPIGAFALIVVEDALDQYVTRWVEGRLHNPFARMWLRMAMNPGRTLSNASSGRAPWSREGRPLTWK
jgi:hypothetical protein